MSTAKISQAEARRLRRRVAQLEKERAELEAERDQYREWWANLSAANREQDARISALTAEIRERCAAARERNRELAAAEARVAELEELLRRTAARATEGPQIKSEKLTREDSP